MNPVQHNTPEMTADESPAAARELRSARAGDAVEVVPVSVSFETMNAENRARWAIGPETYED